MCDDDRYDAPRYGYWWYRFTVATNPDAPTDEAWDAMDATLFEALERAGRRHPGVLDATLAIDDWDSERILATMVLDGMYEDEADEYARLLASMFGARTLEKEFNGSMTFTTIEVA